MTRSNQDNPLRVLLSNHSLTRRTFLAGSAALAGSLALEACLPGSTSTNTSGGTIRLLTYSGNRWERVQAALIPGYAAAKNRQVQLITFPISQGYTRILSALATGSSEYDVIDIDYEILAQTAAHLTSLDSYLKNDAAFATDYAQAVPANVRGLYQYDGRRLGGGTTYGIANDANSTLGFYRSDVFQAAGITSPPETWDEAIKVAAELTTTTSQGKQYGYNAAGQRGIFSAALFGQILFSFGGNWLADNNQPTLTTPEANEAISVLQKLMKYADPSVVNASDSESIAAFASGVAVYAPNAPGNTAYSSPSLSKYGGVTKVTRPPQGNVAKGKHASVMGGFGFAIPAASKQKDTAWDYIKYATNASQMATTVSSTGQPARITALHDAAGSNSFFGALGDALPDAVPLPGWLKDQTGFIDALGTQISLVMTGQKSASSALAQAQQDCTAALKSSGDIT